jgi:O-antigen/teichoic acid export membrane protein
MTGTVIAQFITVAISSILMRLFSPSAFGVLVVYLSIASMVTAIVTLRYD